MIGGGDTNREPGTHLANEGLIHSAEKTTKRIKNHTKERIVRFNYL